MKDRCCDVIASDWQLYATFINTTYTLINSRIIMDSFKSRHIHTLGPIRELLCAHMHTHARNILL